MLDSGVSENQAQVCAFMGIGSNEQEMIPLNLEGKVSLHNMCQRIEVIKCLHIYSQSMSSFNTDLLHQALLNVFHAQQNFFPNDQDCCIFVFSHYFLNSYT